MANIYNRLSRLYSRLQAWTANHELQTAVDEYFCGPRSSSEIADYRARRGQLKKLRDEIVPIRDYLKSLKFEGDVRFPLDNSVPDCWIRQDINSKPIGIEITVAQAREQHLLGEELNNNKLGRGFLGLNDGATSEAFRARLDKPRIMYTSDLALRVVTDGIRLCLEKKNKLKYKGLTLVIEAPLGLIPNERWESAHAELRSAAEQTPFKQIYVIGDRESYLFGFPIKQA